MLRRGGVIGKYMCLCANPDPEDWGGGQSEIFTVSRRADPTGQ